MCVSGFRPEVSSRRPSEAAVSAHGHGCAFVGHHCRRPLSLRRGVKDSGQYEYAIKGCCLTMIDDPASFPPLTLNRTACSFLLSLSVAFARKLSFCLFFRTWPREEQGRGQASMLCHSHTVQRSCLRGPALKRASLCEMPLLCCRSKASRSTSVT